MKKINKEKGFTLIEVLATILIISIAFGIGTYFFINTINNSKAKSKDISLNNIKSSAILYSREYPNNLIWEENGENKSACVTIQDLINAGYYKEKKPEEVTNIKHIILTKNKNNTIINEELDDDHVCELPQNQYMIKYNPNFSIPNGQTFPKIESQICMRNEECELNGISEDYIREGYKFMGWSRKTTGDAEYHDKEKVKNITKGKEITLYAVWKQNKVYIRYNVTGGTLKPQTTQNGVTNNWTHTENGIILKNNKGYIDYNYGSTLESGLANYNNNNNIYITKKGHKAVSGKEWCTEPEGQGKCYDQNTKLTNIGMGEEPDKLCDARQDDCIINLYVNWKKNTITVRYHPNGGTIETPTTTSDGNTTYEWVIIKDNNDTSNNGTIRRKTAEGNKELQTINYGETTTSSGLKNYNNAHFINITKIGYTAEQNKEWCTKANGTGKCFSQGNQNIPANELCDASEQDCFVTLYINWRKTKVYFRFYENEGTVQTPTHSILNTTKYIWTKDEDEALMYNNKYWKSEGIDYGSKVNLPNYNYKYFMNITRENYTTNDGKEWCTGTAANGTCYDQNSDYSDVGIDKNHFCNATKKDCTVDLYVGWKAEKFTIAYNSNGGTGKVASHSCTRGNDCILKANSYTKEGYTFGGWKKENVGNKLSVGANVKDVGQNGDIITYYAQWTPNKVIVRYHPNGGTVAKSNGSNKFTIESDGTIRKNGEEAHTISYGSTTGTGGLINYNSYFGIKKTGYTGTEKAEWCTKANGGGNCYSQTAEIEANDLCDASKGDCIIKLYVNWRKNKVIVRYHPNGGTVTPITGNNQWTIVSGTIRKNGGEVQTINYGGSSSDGLYNYNGSQLKITKNGYHGYSGKEWCTNNNGTGKCYNQSSAIQASELCNASEADCIVTVYVNWQSNPVITVSPDGGSYQKPKQVTITCSANSGIKTFDAWDEKGDHGYKSGNSRTITFSTTGNRTITASCTSNSGKTVTTQKSFTIYSTPPTISFSPNGGSYPTPLNVTITCSAGVNKLNVRDEKGDTGSISGNSRVIQLSSIGARTITATCTSDSGATITEVRNYNIYTPTNSNPSSGGSTGGGQTGPRYCCCHNYVCGTQHEAQNACSGGQIALEGSCPSNGVNTQDNGGCFLAGTKVMTEAGNKDIDKIKVGDKVLTYNEEKNINEYKKVIKLFTFKSIKEELYELTFKDTTLKLTSKHNVYVVNKNKNHYVRAMNLKVGDKVMYSDGTYHKILKITHKQIKETVYNLAINTNHNFYVGDKSILVHNMSVYEHKDADTHR